MKHNNIELNLKDITISEILEREVSEFGTGAHIIVNQKHKGKKCIVIIKK